MPTTPAYTTPGGIIVPAGATTGDMSAILRGLFDGSYPGGGRGLNSQIIPTFHGADDLQAAFPDGTDERLVPPVVRIEYSGLYQYISTPYLKWGPIAGFEERSVVGGRTDGVVPEVVGPGSDYAVTPTLFNYPRTFPYRMDIRFRCLLNAEVDSDRTNVFVRVGGTAMGYVQVQGDGSGLTVFTVEREPDDPNGAGPDIIGGIQKYSGTGHTSAVTTDPNYTQLEVLVRPNYQNVGEV